MSVDDLTALLGVADSVRVGTLTPEEATENLTALLDASAYRRVSDEYISFVV